MKLCSDNYAEKLVDLILNTKQQASGRTTNVDGHRHSHAQNKLPLMVRYIDLVKQLWANQTNQLML